MVGTTEPPSPGPSPRGNWKRWGSADERGTVNLITPAITAKAASLVKNGRVYSLGLPIEHNALNTPSFRERVAPMHAVFAKRRQDGSGSADDYILLNTHALTHIDSVAHDWSEGQLYNGFDANTITSMGAEKCGIDKVGPIVTRGVLLDMARFKGVKSLQRGEAIGRSDILSCAQSENVELQPGDAVLIRTGYLGTFTKEKELEFFSGAPGIGRSAIALFDEIEPAVIGTDTPYLEVEPCEDTGRLSWPIHLELIWKRGASLIELLNLDYLSNDAVKEFLFVAAPLNIKNGLGSPINPVAIC